jgi:protein transport protein SEC24
VCGEGGLLQPATSSYLVRDTGNCSPRNMRSTLSQIPATAELLTSANMPLAVLVQPLALLEPGEEPVQVGSFASPRAVWKLVPGRELWLSPGALSSPQS